MSYKNDIDDVVKKLRTFETKMRNWEMNSPTNDEIRRVRNEIPEMIRDLEHARSDAKRKEATT